MVPRQEFEKPTSTPIEAQFSSWCMYCDEKIHTGEMIVNVSGDWVHQHCERKPAEKLVICQRCWLAKPCNCDDVT
jgi:hypothetical protein